MINFKFELPETQRDLHRRWLHSIYDEFQKHPGQWAKIPSKYDSPVNHREHYSSMVGFISPDDYLSGRRGMAIANREEHGYWGMFTVSGRGKSKNLRRWWARNWLVVAVLLFIAVWAFAMVMTWG